MATTSIFQNYAQLIEHKPLVDVLEDIRNGKYKEKVDAIRTLTYLGNDKDAQNQKKQLPGFTTSGTFEKGRKAQLLTQYSGFVILDLDKLSPDQLKQAKSIAINDYHSFAVFKSPSGNGLKIIVPVSSGAEQHKIAFKQVAEYFEKEMQLAIDPSGKDVSRLCFMSYDPDCFINTSAKPFEISIEPSDQEVTKPVINHAKSKEHLLVERDDWQETFHNCVTLTENKLNYIEGNRNNFIHLLACNCNRLGIPGQIAEGFILQNYDIDPVEASPTIKSAYNNNESEFAKFANHANNAKPPVQNKDELLKNMPFIPDELFCHLPEILKRGCSVFQEPRERDVFLTGALAIISGCLRNVIGLYRAKEHYSNLFAFIIAPAASGKGSLTFAKDLGDKFHDKLVRESMERKKVYDIEMQDHKRKLSDKKQDISELEPPEVPPFKMLFIPANNSSAGVIKNLKEADEQGIFCETEADTMSNAFKQDWGSYSDLMRKAFHHEPITYSRKTNNEYIEIKKPRLSVALAGTPGQVENLIKSAEDGLFSRFIYYTFKSDIEWVDANDTYNGVNLTVHFENLSFDLLNLVEYLEHHQQINFNLTPNQWLQLNNYGKDCLGNLATFVSEDLAGTAKRLGLILYRLAMILTTLRYFDNGVSEYEFTCSDDDFSIALSLVKVYQEHAVFMFGELPKNGNVTDKVLRQFFDALPIRFKRKDAIDVADTKFGIKERTADLYLSKLYTYKWLDKAKNGVYEKVKI